MAQIRRLADSCLLVTTDSGTTLFDPGFFTFDSGEVDLESIGDVQRVLITHEHGDHVKPEFVRWLIDRSADLVVHSNQPVADLLAPHDIEVSVENPPGVSSEDVTHEPLPNGAAPPNRSYTIDGIFTHPGDSFQSSSTAPLLALPLVAPWGSATAAVAFAARLGPRQVFPIHDYYMSAFGRSRMNGLVAGALESHGIELVTLDWNQSITV
jgi:L-ascorbate metabolism protein UlaG (beta-lactamase superfamily)